MRESEQKNDKKVAIIGGGPAGLTAAYELSKKNVKSVVLEKDKMVGGISKTVKYKNYYFDIGGHRFFTKIKAVNKMWHEALNGDFLRRSRLSRIYYQKKFFYYPLRPFNALSGMGFWKSILILVSYLQYRMFPYKEEITLERWVSNRFGKYLYKTFFKAYTEKVWGIPCSEIRAEWAAQRIKGLCLMSAIKNALMKPHDYGGNGNGKENGKVIKSLIDSFEYPKLGPGMMWQSIAEKVQRNGSQVCLETEVDRILWNNNKIELLEVNQNGQKKLIDGTHFISSMPIKELILKLKPTVPDNVLEAATGLNYRDFITVALIINKGDIFPDNWIYIHDPDVKLGRIQNFKNWSPYMLPDQKKTCLGLEYFCFEGDEYWKMSDQQLIELAKRELEILGFAQTCEIEDGTVVRMSNAYPVYDSKYRDFLNVIREFLKGIDNLQLVGRNGMHRYNNMDHSMLTGIYAAENINGANHNLWDVNEELEYHEEKPEKVTEEIIPDTTTARNRLTETLEVV